MKRFKSWKVKVVAALLLSSGAFTLLNAQTEWFNFPWKSEEHVDNKDKVKLYWLTADGLRADVDLFNMYKWAEEGKLPNIKKLMDRGAYGYSTPQFPSLTSNNIATLHTGATSRVHGIIEAGMRIEGQPLSEVAINGFSSTAKNVSPTWSILENAGKKAVVLSVPGSTPPEIHEGVTIRGRWGNWGFDAPAVIFEPSTNFKMRSETIEDFYFSTLDKNLTRFVETKSADGWTKEATTYSDAIEAPFAAHGGMIHAYIYDTTNDGVANYDRVQFATNNKEKIVADLKEGEWSEWFTVPLTYNDTPVVTQAKIRVIKIWPDGTFRIRVLYNSINQYITQPASVAAELTNSVGPMVDFLDNCLCLGMAPQLIVEKEDKQVALEEARMSWNWHRDAAGYIIEKWKPDALIQDFYTPNQMLVSRWWMGDLDPNREGFNAEKAEKSWKDILEMYQGVDAILGRVLEKADENTLIVLSAQHGTAPLYRNARINNLFAKKGWLKFTMDERTKKVTVDWANTKVAYIRMAHVYINPNGLAGDYHRASGEEYEALRKEVIAELENFKDENGVAPVARIVNWENAEEVYELPTDRVGDLVLESTTGYRIWEEMTLDGELFSTPRATGYKEGVNPQDASIQTPFLISGPGVKKGYALPETVKHIDQLPTILNLMNVDVPSYVEGRTLEELIR